MNTVKNFFTSVATLALPVLLVAACAGGQPGQSTPDASEHEQTEAAGDPEELVIGLTYIPDIQFAPFYVADGLGFFTDRGLDVSLRHHGEGEGLFGALMSGKEQLVVAGGDEMLQAAQQEPGLVSVATLYEQYPVAALVPKDSGITEVEDLRGKTIGTPGPYGQTYFGLLALLDAGGLSVDDVNVEYIGFTQLSALATDAVDVVMGFQNNEPTAMAVAGIDVNVIPLPDSAALVGTGLVSEQQVIDQRGAELDLALDAIREAIALIQEDPEQAVEVSADYIPGFSDVDFAETVEVLENTAKLYGTATLTNDADQWQAMSDFMLDAGLLETPVDVSSHFLQ